MISPTLAILLVIFPPPGNIATIHRCYIEPSERNKGRGTQFLNEFEQSAQESGATIIQTLVKPDPGESKVLITRFLEKHGYIFDSDVGLGPLYRKKLGSGK
ncbi:hypothetical protein A2773_07240 [Candidatus Gottesmanbacteria bacterium RIFCSPHIGHO2_01_FULL_39_10]|uniref:N-acetyltransferase domain-containing protein n=1 Tax=Candidatus Gottesmanbacteria bacterium RIFCSPHIGHO2_01_FULL_39_10 TaxID=1798375 RepID=A0A1F5ZNS7_9BACT|nr:MAG: hypothetical protein A2773_07240 [Candidatus Gottesmanbacteria bacterium RIFCSPHIGHO2_01_FULL_39_10]